MHIFYAFYPVFASTGGLRLREGQIAVMEIVGLNNYGGLRNIQPLPPMLRGVLPVVNGIARSESILEWQCRRFLWFRLLWWGGFPELVYLPGFEVKALVVVGFELELVQERGRRGGFEEVDVDELSVAALFLLACFSLFGIGHDLLWLVWELVSLALFDDGYALLGEDPDEIVLEFVPEDFVLGVGAVIKLHAVNRGYVCHGLNLLGVLAF